MQSSALRESVITSYSIHYTKLYEFFGSTKKNQIVIGEKLALKLKVKVGNKLIITMQDGDKNIVSAAFKVVGIFATDIV